MPSRPNIRFGGHREDKENQGPSRDRGGHTTIGVPGHSGMILIHEDEDEDGPILYRDDDDDDDELEDEGTDDRFFEFRISAWNDIFPFFFRSSCCKTCTKRFSSPKIVATTRSTGTH